MRCIDALIVIVGSNALKTKPLLVFAAGTMVAVLGAVFGPGAWAGWKASRPSQESFDKLARSVWDKQARPAGSRYERNSLTHPCLSVPLYPEPDARSRATEPMAWHLDFVTDALPSPQRQAQRNQIDALVDAGLMEESFEVGEVKGSVVPVKRFRLSEKGWLASGYGRASCFEFGVVRYLGVTGFSPRVVNTEAGLEFYEIHARYGIAAAQDLAPWAANPGLQEQFPEVRKALEGQEFVILAVRGGGGWVDYQSMMQKAMRAKSGVGGTDEDEATRAISDETRAEIRALEALAPPAPEEIKAHLLEMNEAGNPNPLPSSCLYLPGGYSTVPVDVEMGQRNPPRYKVAIVKNKVRPTWDPVAKRTMPYLDRLEALGVLTKTAGSIPDPKGEPQGAVQQEAEIYELAPRFTTGGAERSPACLSLGMPTVQFVEIRILDRTVEGYPFSSFRYKLRIRYQDPPVWMKDPALTKNWSELRGVVENGKACSGEFSFDRRTRKASGGAGGCWWAFDSYIENG